jgi:acetoacetyl-CoA synthetase
MDQIMWAPSGARAAGTRMAEFGRWLEAERGLRFAGPEALWAWSVEDLEGFWGAVVAFFGLRIEGAGPVLGRSAMPGAEWFPGARTSLAAHVLAHAALRPAAEALVLQSETFGRRVVTWADLAARVGAAQAGLGRLGVGPGDRVVAVLPNGVEAIVAFLACASLGAVWSLAAPDMGAAAVIDRFRQIEPKVLIGQESLVHAGRVVDRRAELARIAEALPGLAARVGVAGPLGPLPGWLPWDELTASAAAPVPVLMPFEAPLWIVYSSGTTGSPKAIVHGQGGILLEMSKAALHLDLRAVSRFAWLTSSGWIMWNAQLFALLQGATVALFDGAPGHPDLLEVWRMVARERLTHFGAGAAFLQSCLKAGVAPGALDLSALEMLGSTGSPLSADAYDWVYRAVKPDVWLAPISGGTDIAGAFVGGHPMLPVRRGEMQGRCLGAAVEAWDESGRPLTGQVGELVVTRPMPSMPLYFWGDADGSRLREAYFEPWPGVWRHGDWIEISATGGVVIHGRSDATINRHGLRLGSAEIYRSVEGLEDVADSLVVDLEYLGRPSELILFVVPVSGVALDAALEARIRGAIRADVSGRFVPDTVVALAEVPRTLSGKKLEVPVRKLLLGTDPARAVNREAMANPAAWDALVEWARGRLGPRQGLASGGGL